MSKTQTQVNRELAIQEMAAKARQDELAYKMAAAEEANEFISPQEGLFGMARQAQGFDPSTGTSAGGTAYIQGYDFGTPINISGRDAMYGVPQAPEQLQFDPYQMPEEIELLKIEEFKGDINRFNDLGRKLVAAGIDKNKAYFDEPEKAEYVRQYWQQYNDILAKAEGRKQGYQATKLAAEKGRGLDRQGEFHQFTDAFDTKQYDNFVMESNKMAKTLFARGAEGEAQQSLDDARNQLYNQASMLEQQGRFQQANLARMKADSIGEALYDPRKQQELALKKRDLDRKDREFDLKKNFGKEKYNLMADLNKNLFMLENQGDMSFINKYIPGTTIDYTATEPVLVIPPSKGFGDSVRIPTSKHDAIVDMMIKANPKAFTFDRADWQKFTNEMGGYTPSKEENWFVQPSSKWLWKEVLNEDGELNSFNISADKIKNVSDKISEVKDVIKIDGKGVTNVTPDKIGNEVNITLSDGTQKSYSLTSSDDVNKLDQIIKSTPPGEFSSYMSKHPDKYKVINPEDDDGTNIFNRVQRQGGYSDNGYQTTPTENTTENVISNTEIHKSPVDNPKAKSFQDKYNY